MDTCSAAKPVLTRDDKAEHFGPRILQFGAGMMTCELWRTLVLSVCV